MTEKASYRLTLKEKGDETPFFMLEPIDRELSIVADQAWLGIELRPGISFREAQRAWKTLDGIIEGLSYTVPPSGEE